MNPGPRPQSREKGVQMSVHPSIRCPSRLWGSRGPGRRVLVATGCDVEGTKGAWAIQWGGGQERIPSGHRPPGEMPPEFLTLRMHSADLFDD